MNSPAADILRQLATPTVSRQRTATAPNNKSPNQRACWITSAASLLEPYPPPQLTSQAGPSGFARRRYALPRIPSTLSHMTHATSRPISSYILIHIIHQILDSLPGAKISHSDWRVICSLVLTLRKTVEAAPLLRIMLCMDAWFIIIFG